MPTSSTRETRRRVLFCLCVLGIAIALFILPFQFRSQAVSQKGEGLFERTSTQEPDIRNYDIRSDKNAVDTVIGFRQSQGRGAAEIADIRDRFVRGEESLRTTVPTLKVDYNTDIRIPEVIGPDVQKGRAVLTRATSGKRSDTLVNFLKQNDELTGVRAAQVQELKVVADYMNPAGNLAFVELNQEINGIPVFRGEVKAGFTPSGEMFRVINNLAPGLDYGSLSTEFGDPAAAVRSAAGYIKHDVRADDVALNAKASNNLKAVFGNGDEATTAEKMYFPTEPGVAVPAWRVLIWQPVNAYYVIVDAASGAMLWRKNLGADQTQAATYQVYTNPNAMINVAENPAPLTPGPTDPNTGAQGAITTRSNITLIGNEPPYTFNNLGWITDGGNTTGGNNLSAGIDRDGTNGVDIEQTGTPSRTFDSTWNPPPGNPAPGDAPLTTQAQRGAVIQMFYIMNRYHDELYQLGFNEQAHNFQANNFGRGGTQGDRVSAEGQDSSGTNNANFNTGADGTLGRMQMYLWTGPNPDRDGTTDAEVMIHEATHGTSIRLHGNGSGLSLNISGAMGEGWGDFFAHAMLSEPSDPLDGVYALGGYALNSGFSVVGTKNYYYGIRRFPKARMSFTGGPNNRPHNPMTFADIDQSQLNTSDGAFPAMSGAHISTAADQVHAAGEVWSSALWEVRCKMVERSGWAIGNRKAMQAVTDGMKLAPLGPTFLTERDAIIAGLLASGTAGDVADTWSGFAVRGMGASASIQNNGTGTGTARVTEAFDLPNLFQSPTITVSDSTGDNDGFPEPGETVNISVPLTNQTGNAATGTTLQIVGAGSANYGTISHNTTASQNISYTIPGGTACGSVISLTLNANSSLGPVSFTRFIIVGVPITTFQENFDGVTAPAFPAGWTAASVASGTNFVTSTNNNDTAPNSAFALDPTSVGGGTDLTSPSMPITAPAAVVSFRNRFDTEGGWDGGALEISIGAGAFQDIITAGGRFVENGYTGVLGAGTNNPLANRLAWNGNSGGYITSRVQLPAAAAGQNVRLKWRFGADDNTAGLGWNVDTIQVAGNYGCSFVAPTVRSRADFDGDGKTDVSVFRPADGNWYLDRSTAGFTAVHWGLGTDRLIPGDYDSDGKTDTAVFRASNVGGDPDFLVLKSNGFVYTGIAWGSVGDIPVIDDFDGDGLADYGVFRPSDGTWYVLSGTGGGMSFIPFGQNGDLPIAGDFDGDGLSDRTVFRAGQWITLKSSGGVTITPFGLASDIPVPADYDGDNKVDIAVFRPSAGDWYWLKSSNGAFDAVHWGANGDVPVPGDYDGDGKDDQAVFRGGAWYMNRSTAGFAAANFGLATDQAIPRAYLP
jgi:Fungalysin metallopeptidase (M36)